MQQVSLVRGHWVMTGAAPGDRVITDGAVAIAGDSVLEIGDWADLRARHPDAPVIGSGREAVIPGATNAHHHSAGVTHLQQGVADDLLEPWLLALQRLRPMDIRLSTLVSAARLLRSGVTSVVDVHSGGGSARDYADNMRRALAAYDTAGIRVAFAAGHSTQSHIVHGAGEDEKFLATLPAEVRALAAATLPDPDEMTDDEYFAVMDDAWRAHRSHPRIDVWFAPPGPQWVSDAMMQRIAERTAALDTGVQTHVAESFYEKLYGPRFRGKPILAHLRDLGVLGPRFSIAHGVWLTAAEIAILAETGAAVSHNPSSNLRLRAGIAPLNAMRAAGATLALGMDGTTLNDDEDMFTEMRLAMRLHRTPRLDGPAPSPLDVWHMATAGGAKLMRKENRLGRIAPGYLADLVLVRLDRLTWPWVAPEADPRELLLMRAGGRDVDTVLVGGAVALRGGLPTGFDVEAVARELAAELAAEPFPAAAARLVAGLYPHLVRHYLAWPTPELAPSIAYNSSR